MDLKDIVLEYVDKADDRLLKMIKAIAESYQEETVRDTMKEYNEQLDRADERIDSGKFHTQQEAEKIARQW